MAMRGSWKDDIGHWAAAIAATAAFVAIAVIAVVWYGGSPAAPAGLAVQAQAKAQPPAARRPVSPAPLAVRHAAMPHSGTTMLAAVRCTSPRYAAPGMRAPGEVPATWWGVQSVLPVVATRPGWVEVRLAQRPNGSTAWLPVRDVTLSSTRYLITIDLATMRLALYSGSRRVFSAPAGIGSVTDPTPTGHYFVAFTEPPPQPNPGYGPFILVTSAHSQAIGDWEGSGDAVIGIHGPLGDGSLIGTTGARISHGCIRLHVSALLKLRDVPPGTPIDIFG
jgi:lipoprotein-anchoring transpeptidase ErfK/SrfK